jgi:site-specific recombinase XerD
VSLALEHAERLLTQPDIDTFVGVRDAAIIGLLIGCGLRVSGLCNLNESDLLWYHDKDLGREVLTLRAKEKGHKKRLVPAPDEARLLRTYLGHEVLEGIDRTLPSGDKVVFVSVRNRTLTEDRYYREARRITPSSVHDLIQRYGAAAGIPQAEAHPHALRHLYGTELAEAGVDLIERQQLFGHANPQTTAIYTHLASRRLREASERANPLGKIRTPVSELAAYCKSACKTDQVFGVIGAQD